MITKTFEKIQHLTMIFVKNIFNQLGLERNPCNPIKYSFKKKKKLQLTSYLMI